MRLNRTDAFWDRTTRNSINENWDILEGTTKKIESDFKNVVNNITDEVVDQLVDSAKLNWKEPVGTYNNLPINPEVGETRMVRDTGKVYRFDGTWKEIQQIDAGPVNEVDSRLTAQLEVEVQYRDHIVSVGERANQCAIVFEDDDGNSELYTRLYPIFKNKGVKFGAAIITGFVGKPGYITLNQLKEMHENNLETLSHAHDYGYSLLNLSDEEADYQLRESQKWLQENGFEYEGFVYPQNAHNLKLRKMVRKYYRYAFRGGGLNDLGYLEHSTIRRMAFGSFTNPNPDVPGIPDKSSLEYYKYWVDQAIEKKSLLVFMTHAAAQPIEQDVILGQLIDYILSKGIDIVAPSEGFRMAANKIDVGDLEAEHFLISREGNLKTSLLSPKGIEWNSKTPSDPIAVYENKSISVVEISSSFASTNGFPKGRAGMFYTYKHSSEYPRYNWQEYHIYGSNDKYVRYAIDDTTWSQWENQSSKTLFSFNNVTNEMTPNDFPPEKMSICSMSQSYMLSQNFPTKKSAILTTVIADRDNIFAQQELKTSDEILFRSGRSGAWGPWYKVSLTVV